MLKKICIAALALAAIPFQAMSQNMPAPVGVWDCFSNSPIVSIQLRVQIGPDGSTFGQGSITYVQTSRIYQVQGPGRWLPVPPEAGAPRWTYGIQIQPQSHAIFSIYAAPTDSPNFLFNRFVNPQTGGVTETSCQRIG